MRVPNRWTNMRKIEKKIEKEKNINVCKNKKILLKETLLK